MNQVTEAITLIDTDDQLRQQVAHDLEKRLADYKGPKIGIRLMSEKMDISERTLYRLIKLKNRPTYQTLLKIYRVLLNTVNDSAVLALAPEIVRDEVLKFNPNIQDGMTAYTADIEGEIYYDKCFAEIYFMASASPVTRELVTFRHGMNGVETLERMVELRALRETKKGHFVLGENRANFTAKTLKRIGLSFSEKFSKPQNAEVGGKNLIGFFAEGLSDEAYDRWLQIDEDAYYKKVKIAREDGAKGSTRAFTFMVTDTMTNKLVKS